MKNVQIFVYKQTILPVLEKLHHAHIQLHQNSGWWNTGGRDRYMFTMEKGVILQKCLNTFVPHCSSPSL